VNSGDEYPAAPKRGPRSLIAEAEFEIPRIPEGGLSRA
jgi:hypothetical protein